MTGARDIITDFLTRLMEMQPTFSEELAVQMEQQLRHEWGGQQVTIAKRAPVLRKAREKARAQIGIKSVDELKEECGVSRRTLYRWIAKQPKEE